MWIRKEQVAVFAVLLTLAWAGSFCNVENLDALDVDALSGTLYPALVSNVGFAAQVSRLGGLLTPYEKNGKQYVTLKFYYTLSEAHPPTCRSFQEDCAVTNNACQYSDGLKFYLLAQDDKYVALYTPRGGDLYTLEIYARDYDLQQPLQIGDVSSTIRDTIADRCGEEYTQPGAYPRQFPPGNFIPDCQ